MLASESAQNLLAFACDTQDCPSPVVAVSLPREQSFALGPVHKLNRAVVFQLKAAGGVGDGHRCPLRRSSHLQQKLVLLRVHPRVNGRAFAEVQKSP